LPCWTPRFFVISSNLKTTNTRSVVFLPAVLDPVYISLLDPLLGSAKGARKGPLALWHKVNADGPFRPSGSWRGQRSGVGPCFRDAGPGSKAKPSARRHMDWSPETSLGGRRGGELRIYREAQAEIPIPLFTPVKSARPRLLSLPLILILIPRKESGHDRSRADGWAPTASCQINLR